jgi:hypothetical protein
MAPSAARLPLRSAQALHTSVVSCNGTHLERHHLHELIGAFSTTSRLTNCLYICKHNASLSPTISIPQKDSLSVVACCMDKAQRTCGCAKGDTRYHTMPSVARWVRLPPLKHMSPLMELTSTATTSTSAPCTKPPHPCWRTLTLCGGTTLMNRL